MAARRSWFLRCLILTIKLSAGRRPGEALNYLDRCSGVFNIWRQPLGATAPTQITNFTEDAIFYYDWDDEGQLIAARGAKIRDIVLIRNFA